MKLMLILGLHFFMVFMWASAELKSEKEPTDEIQIQEYESESRVDIHTRDMACSNINGKCINKNRKCPKNRPLSKPPGSPFCNKQRHCCYSIDDSAESVCGEGKFSDGYCAGPLEYCLDGPLDAKCVKKGYHCCKKIIDNSIEPVCGVGPFSHGICIKDGLLCGGALPAKCAKGYYCCDVPEDDTNEPICGKGKFANDTCLSDGHLCVKSVDAKCAKGYYCCNELEVASTEPICGVGNDGKCIRDGHLCPNTIGAKCDKGYYCCENTDDSDRIWNLCGWGTACQGNNTVCLPTRSEIACATITYCKCSNDYYRCCDLL